MNLKMKTIALLLLSVLIPLIVLSVFTYNFMRGESERQSIISVAATTERSVQQFDNQCEVLANNLSNIANSANLKNYISARDNAPNDANLLMQHIRLYNVELTSFVLFSGRVRALLVLLDDLSLPFVRRTPSFTYYGDYLQDPLYRLGKEANVAPVWVYSETKEGQPYLSVVTAVSNGYQTDGTGVVILELQLDMLADYFTLSSGQKSERMLLLDQERRVLFDSDATLSSTIASWDWLQGIEEKETGFYVELDGQRYLVTHRVSDVTGWLAVDLLLYRHIAEAANQHRAFTILLTGLCIFPVVLIASLCYSMFYRPVRGLMNAMKQFGKGDLDMRLSIRKRDEIGALYWRYNEMADQIKRLIREVSAYQQRQKDLEIHFMQAQTIPHFLSNSLCNITVLAQTNRRDEIIRMSTALERLTRVISKRELMIPLADEVCYVLDYIEVMRLRYQTEIAVSIAIPDEALQVRLPKFTLQPLVENCIQHAFSDAATDWRIEISGVFRGDDLTILIRDNGQGTKRTLEEILAGDGDTYRVGIGLRNVHERLQLLYDARYGLEFESQEGKGTTVYVVIPRQCPVNPQDNAIGG